MPLEDALEARWRAGRLEYAGSLEGPWSGAHPAEEAFDEALDLILYIGVWARDFGLPQQVADEMQTSARNLAHGIQTFGRE